MIDLHVHTNASSDGVHSPREIFDMAHRLGLEALAFADHNATDSIDEGLQLSRDYAIPFVPAIELNSSRGGHDIHILGYFIEHRSPDLRELLDRYAEEVVAQTARRVELLNKLGLVLEGPDVMAASGGMPPTGRSFLVALMGRDENRDNALLARYTTGDRSASPSQYFYQDLLAGGRPADVPLRGMTTEAAIACIRAAGGIPVLAHPGVYPQAVVEEVIGMGIRGLEAYSGYHDRATAARFVRLCTERGLLVSAGSDFHGKEIKPDIGLGAPAPGGFRLYASMNRAHRKEYAQGNA